MTPFNQAIGRRTLITAAIGTGVAASVGIGFARSDPDHGLAQNPFTLGVASGDPLPDSVVLWTRLALDPTADDGLGGIGRSDVPVSWEIAEDEQFTRVVRRGRDLALARFGYSVHAEPRGLRPGWEYFYRFRAGRHLSPTGRTRTTPSPDEMPASLAMSFASCAAYEQGWFNAYGRMADDQPDLILHLGDYMYEYGSKAMEMPSGPVRDHAGPETVTLAGYRQRFSQYHSDPDLQAAHAISPWLVVWDDHEVDNNWAGDIPENQKADQMNDTRERFLERRKNAFQAYWENMPLRRSTRTLTSDMKIFQRVPWGVLANFHMLDTRQYRDDQACGDGWRINCAPAADPNRSIMGAQQEAWLLDGFKQSKARWDVLGQQVFFSARTAVVEGGVRRSMDAWDGYSACRDRITRGWVDAGVRNAVVLTGDVHRHWAAEVKTNYDDPSSPVVGAEFVCSSISTNGDGDGSTTDAIMPFNPHLKFFNNHRGYVRTKITPNEMSADYRNVEQVSKQNSQVVTKASFVVNDQQPGLTQTL